MGDSGPPKNHSCQNPKSFCRMKPPYTIRLLDQNELPQFRNDDGKLGIPIAYLLQGQQQNLIFEPTCANCTVGSYASPSVCLSVSLCGRNAN